MFQVREFPQFIFPVLREFFSGYSGFPPSLKSTHGGHSRVLGCQHQKYCHVVTKVGYFI